MRDTAAFIALIWWCNASINEIILLKWVDRVNNKTYYFEITALVLIAKVGQEKIIFETGFTTVYLASLRHFHFHNVLPFISTEDVHGIFLWIFQLFPYKSTADKVFARINIFQNHPE